MTRTHIVVRKSPRIGPLGFRQTRTSKPMAHAAAVQVARFYRSRWGEDGWEVEVRAVGGAR